MYRRLLLMAAAVAAALAGLLAPASAQPSDFPTKPITLIVPFQAGVSADLLFRGIAEAASTHLGQPVIIDNKPGGSATLGPATMAGTAKPDGYTIGQIAIPVFRVPYMQKATFDPVKDFTYIILMGGYNLGAVVKADGPFKKWQDVIDFAKANPGKFTYTTIGAATTNAIAMELMARQSGVQFTHIPSKGGGESLAADPRRPHHGDGGIAGLGLAGRCRAAAPADDARAASAARRWPDVPVLKELGYTYEFDSPFGLAGPKGMDPAVVKKLHDAFKKAYDDPKVAELYEKYDYSSGAT